MLINQEAVRRYIEQQHTREGDEPRMISREFFEKLDAKIRRSIDCAASLPSNRKRLRDLASLSGT